jgi:hypothetical protein
VARISDEIASPHLATKAQTCGPVTNLAQRQAVVDGPVDVAFGSLQKSTEINGASALTQIVD